jgi:hypothetical protein
METVPMSAAKLNAIFGDDWCDAMQGLMDLRIVRRAFVGSHDVFCIVPKSQAY